MQVKYGPIGQVYLELTNACNFDCTFCPNSIMTRKIGFMKKELAERILDEIVKINLTKRVMFHLMGEPTLHPNYQELIYYAKSKGLEVVLNTNGSRLDDKALDKLLDGCLYRLIISYQTPNERTFALRKAHIDFEHYSAIIRRVLEKKVELGSKTRVELHLLNSIDADLLGLDEDFMVMRTRQDAVEVLEDWLRYGRKLEKNNKDYPRLKERPDLDAIDLKKGFIVEILKDVFIVSRKLTSWGNTMVKGKTIMPAVVGGCDGVLKQFGIQWDGTCVICCVDFDGKTNMGNLNKKTLKEIWLSPRLNRIRRGFNTCQLVHPYCKTCRGGPTVKSWLMRQLGSIVIYRLGSNYIYSE
jgi:radical SAM protein with 4Fe4S-binding SPASM domain